MPINLGEIAHTYTLGFGKLSEANGMLGFQMSSRTSSASMYESLALAQKKEKYKLSPSQ